MTRAVFMHMLFLAMVASQALGARPVARVLEVKGNVRLENADGFEREALVFGTAYAGERIELPADSRLALAFRIDGHIERIVGPAALTVTDDGCEPKDLKRISQLPKQHAQSIQRAVKQLPPITRGGATIVRGSGDHNDRRVRPTFNTVVPDTRPVFRWLPLPGAKWHELSVCDMDGETWSIRCSGTSNGYTAEAPLQYGTRYKWEVIACLEGQPPQIVCDGAFFVATEREVEVASTLRELIGKSDAVHLALAAMWYRQSGMIDQAMDVAEHLVKLAPKNPSHHLFMAELLERAGRADAAEVARRRAEQLNRETGKDVGPP